MNRSRWRLLALLVPIVLAAQLFVNSWPVKLIAVDASDGSIFAAVSHSQVNDIEIWKWSSDLSQRDPLWRLPDTYLKALRTTRDGSTVICATPHAVVSYDVTRRRKLWTRGTENTSAVHLVDQDRYLMLIESANFGYGWGVMTLLDTTSGKVIDTQQLDSSMGISTPGLNQAYFDDDLVTFELSNGQVMAFTADSGKIQRVDDTAQNVSKLGRYGSLLKYFPYRNSIGRSIADPRSRDFISASRDVLVVPATTGTPSTIRIVETTNGVVLNQDQLGVSHVTKCLLGAVVVLSSVIWVLLLIRDGWQSGYRYRLWIDLGILIAVMTLPYVGGLGDLVPSKVSHAQAVGMFAVPLGVVCCLLFLFVMGTRNKIYIWTVLLSSCVVPVLLPVVGTSIAGRLVGFLSPVRIGTTKSKPISDRETLQFGISELLLATAAMAILFWQGQSNVYLIPLGVGCAVVFVMAVLLSIDLWISIATVIICTVFVVLFALNGTRAWPAAGVAMTVLAFSFLRLYGFAIETTNNSQTQKVGVTRCVPQSTQASHFPT